MPGSADSITGTSQRATCWSITINNPETKDYDLTLPPNWKLTGQLEEGKQGTKHYQGCLQTPQVRFSAVKKLFPRAHIEIARNKGALINYVHKDDTRVGEVADSRGATIPTLFEYQHTVAKRIVGRFVEHRNYGYTDFKKLDSKHIMSLVDRVVQEDIEDGINGIEYIAINPMWIAAWKKFGKSMLVREFKVVQHIKDNDDTASIDDNDLIIQDCQVADGTQTPSG